MTNVLMANLQAFNELRSVLAERELPQYQQVVHTHPDVLEPDELEWLRENDIDIVFSWFVPRDRVWITRKAR